MRCFNASTCLFFRGELSYLQEPGSQLLQGDPVSALPSHLILPVRHLWQALLLIGPRVRRIAPPALPFIVLVQNSKFERNCRSGCLILPKGQKRFWIE